GQYVDGHERDDVVSYCQNTYIPRMIQHMTKMWRYIDGSTGWAVPPDVNCPTIIWFHDESTFYAHDHWQNYWMPPGSSPTPYTKGEGQSLMVANFVSADYGWLGSPDGKESARVLF
ncbi:hypothetical protein P691DRAFT_687180, partial [Macrolepiota fuliginosa MF-IS2]